MDITKEQLMKYKNILNLEDVIDMEILFTEYRYALSDYYHAKTYDLKKLTLIIDAFNYFSNFEVIENDYENLVNKGLKLLEEDENKDATDYKHSELVYMISMLISKDLLEAPTKMNMEQLTIVCRILYKLFSTVQGIEQYEKNNLITQKIKSTN